MGEVFVLIAGVVVSVVVMTCLVAAIGVRTARRRVRLAAGPRVPLWWALSPSQPARLHRRLLQVDRAAALLAPPRRRRGRPAVTPADQYAVQVRDSARLLDSELRQVSVLPRAIRPARLAELSSGVGALEESTIRLHTIVRPPAPDLHAFAEKVRLFTDSYHHLDADR